MNEEMDPLEELKSLLNIPEGMTAAEALERAKRAGETAADHWETEDSRALYGTLEDAWWCVADLLKILEQAKNAPSA
jgi:hypothetical protein